MTRHPFLPTTSTTQNDHAGKIKLKTESPLYAPRPPSGRLPPPWPHAHRTLADLDALNRTITLASRTAQSSAVHAQLRRLTPDDLDDLHALHRVILASLPHPHVLRADERDFLALHLEERGRTFGAFIDGRLMAYAALSMPGPDSDNLGRDIGLTEEQARRVSHHDGSGVHPSLRGSSLHATLNDLRYALADASGYTHVMGTVSTFNPFSLRNHLKGGMVVRDIVVKYGGMARLIIHRDLRAPWHVPAADIAPRQTCPIEDIDGHRHCIDSGLWGVAVTRDADGTFLVEYSPRHRIDMAALPETEH